jgi:hypothetical protein
MIYHSGLVMEWSGSLHGKSSHVTVTAGAAKFFTIFTDLNVHFQDL